jgi:hypothetical protein
MPWLVTRTGRNLSFQIVKHGRQEAASGPSSSASWLACPRSATDRVTKVTIGIPLCSRIPELSLIE